ncbi:hypothetical protein [Moraxella porci]|uniref:hypothetical protein n=1 Tax=Moraxella porci TaxID=1288392 RepID=UPI00244CEC95|nr:hypothetical protein [Moraxella porci]MDH2272970.1 hypothetical protein [Moraxella porci]
MIIDSLCIDINIAQKRAGGEMCISPDLTSNDWIVIEYDCDLVTYHEPAEYCDGYLVYDACDVCEDATNVRYRITEKGNDARCYDNVHDIVADFVVQKANFPDIPDLFTYRGVA